MKREKRLQIGLPAAEEIADEKRQHSRHNQKDDDKHIGERGREIADELASEDGQDIAHGGAHAAASTAGSVEAVVISRNTSSSRPCSTRNKPICQRWARARSAISATMSSPPRGKISNPLSSPSGVVSTDATAGSRISSARNCSGAAPVATRRTALWRGDRRASSAGVASASMRP